MVITRRKKAEDLRSHRWLGVNDMRSFGHRSRLKQFGYDGDDWDGKPVIGIVNTWSDINACHAHLRARAENVKRGDLAGGRLPDRTAGDVARRAVREALDHALSQFPRDGGRGTAALPSDRRRGAARRLRQDHARPDHGRDQHGHPGDLRARRPDAARQLARAISRLGLRRLEVLDGKARRQHHRRAMGGDGGRHRALVRHMHGDGDGRDHDGDLGGARPDAAGRIVDPGGRFQSSAHVRRRRPAHRRHGVGGPHARPHPDAGRVRQRDQGAHVARRLDQRHHPCGGDGAPRRHQARHAAFRRAVARDSGAWRISARRANT